MTYDPLDNVAGTPHNLKEMADIVNATWQQQYSVDSSGVALAGVQKKFWATGASTDAQATFRTILATDIPTLNQNTSGNAATVTTNANLTGHITSVGNATSLGSFSKAQLDAAVSDANIVYSDSVIPIDTVDVQNWKIINEITGLYKGNRVIPNTTSSLSTGSLVLTSIYIGNDINTITDIEYMLLTAGNYTANNTNGACIFGTNGTTITHIGNYGSDASFKTTVGRRAISSLSVDVSAYTYIYVGLIYNNSAFVTPPAVAGNSPDYTSRSSKYESMRQSGVTNPSSMDGYTIASYGWNGAVPSIFVKGIA